MRKDIARLISDITVSLIGLPIALLRDIIVNAEIAAHDISLAINHILIKRGIGRAYAIVR